MITDKEFILAKIETIECLLDLNKIRFGNILKSIDATIDLCKEAQKLLEEWNAEYSIDENVLSQFISDGIKTSER